MDEDHFKAMKIHRHLIVSQAPEEGKMKKRENKKTHENENFLFD